MANQMIALQSRAPQNSFIGDAVRQNSQLINMMTQQAAAQRQAQQAQQAMDIAAAKAERDAASGDVALIKAKLENTALAMQNARDKLQSLPPGDVAAAEAYRQDTIAALPELKGWMPSAEAIANDPGTRARLGAEAKAWIDKNVPTARAEVQIDPRTNELMEVRTGGFSPDMAGAGAYPIQRFAFTPDQPAAATSAPAAPAATAPEVSARATKGAATGPQDLLEQGVNPRSIPMGNPLQPVSFNPTEVAALTVETAPQIIQAAVQNGVIDEAHVQQLRQMVGPENDQALATWMRQNNVRIQPANAPQMRSAVYRPEMGEATMQQAGYAPTGTVAQGKPPMQSPMPGSAIVPLPRVRGEAEAGAAGQGAVDVVVKPQVKARELDVERVAKLRSGLPAAHNQTETVVADLTQRINAIDEFLRHPNRNAILGSIEGRIPEGLMNEKRADAIALWNAIKNNSVLEQLIQDRQKTETGASPMGFVSDRDLSLAADAANRLTRIGSEGAQDKELRRLRKILYDTLQRATRSYTNTFSEVLGANPRFKITAPAVTPEYKIVPPGQRRAASSSRATGSASGGWGKASVVGD